MSLELPHSNDDSGDNVWEFGFEFELPSVKFYQTLNFLPVLLLCLPSPHQHDRHHPLNDHDHQHPGIFISFFSQYIAFVKEGEEALGQ